MRARAFAFALVLLLPGCASAPQQATQVAAAAIPAALPADRAARMAFRARMRAVLDRGDYRRLTAVADSLRKNHSRFADGREAILEFVTSFSLLDTPEAKNAAAWSDMLSRIEHWRAAEPAATLPDVVLAQTLVELGWKSRGGGYAFTVADKGWAGFEQALARAREALDVAAAKRPPDIEWYFVSSRVALGLGWTSEESQRLFEGAVAQDSTCAYPYFVRADFLLPRWYGEPGEWEKWLWEAADHLPQDEGDQVYALACVNLSHFHRDFFRETRVSWVRMRRGLRLLVRRHPDSETLVQEFAFNATLAGDVSNAHAMFKRMHGFDPELWRGERSFRALYAWTESRYIAARSAAAN